MNEVRQDSCKNADSSHITSALSPPSLPPPRSATLLPYQVSAPGAEARWGSAATPHPRVCLLPPPNSAALALPALRVPGSQVENKPMHRTFNMPGLMILFIFKTRQLCTLPLWILLWLDRIESSRPEALPRLRAVVRYDFWFPPLPVEMWHSWVINSENLEARWPGLEFWIHRALTMPQFLNPWLLGR